ncbi:MAG: F0F1 ATP synthase subunit B [Pontiellaceae bacterium]|nr:F0F1 ATP synthase subunit B [Pontiellaceae bacterium]
MSTLTLAVAESPIERFGINWYDFASQAIAFLIIAWILNKFVFKPVMKTVAERQRIADEAAADSARIKQELHAIEEERSKVLQTAQEQAEQVIAEAKTHVADLISKEKQRCEALGTEMLAQAREEARLDQARLKTELRGEIATMIVSLTAKLTQMNLKEADRERLLQSAIDELTATAKEPLS